ncbi:MAG: hypothetical protein Q6359_02130 [Candidatus Brocadiales bacterium]|nr:hypothetical protein [Candidatus Brocadiales bacterium]
MGCDIFYKCESAETASVERLTALIKRWAEETKLPYRLVNIKNCTLGPPWNVPKEPDYGRIKGELVLLKTLFNWEDKEVTEEEEEIKERQSEIRRNIEYLRRCKEGVDLYGILIGRIPLEEEISRIAVAEDGTYKVEAHSTEGREIYGNIEVYSRGQFIFDVQNGGRLVRLVTKPEYYQASNVKIPCFFFEAGGYWRSVKEYDALPRFLALCKIRYLPLFEIGDDYNACEYYMELFCADKEQEKEITMMSDDEFYDEYVRKYVIIG